MRSSFAPIGVFVLVACSGADMPPPDDAGSGTDAKGDARADAGGNPDGAVDSGGGKDFPSSPGDIPCGNITCLSASFACCETRNGTMTMVSCTDPGTCPMGAMSVELDCNEAADCNMGEVCCRDTTGATTKCVMGSCTSGTQICTKNAECLTGACNAYSCPVEGTVHACGLPTGCK